MDGAVCGEVCSGGGEKALGEVGTGPVSEVVALPDLGTAALAVAGGGCSTA